MFLTSAVIATPSKVIVIRHGEKPLIGNHLSKKGRQRAEALVPYITENFGRPDSLYAFKPDHTDSSQRGIETLEPLSKNLDITIQAPYGKDGYNKLAHLLLSDPIYNGKFVIICWEHHDINPLVMALGGPDTGKYPGNVYDRVYVLRYLADKTVDFQLTWGPKIEK